MVQKLDARYLKYGIRNKPARLARIRKKSAPEGIMADKKPGLSAEQLETLRTIGARVLSETHRKLLIFEVLHQSKSERMDELVALAIQKPEILNEAIGEILGGYEYSWVGNITRYEILQKLLKSGIMDAKGSVDGWTYLALACNYVNPNIIKMLITHGADPNKANDDGSTPLECLASPEEFITRDSESISILLEAGARITGKFLEIISGNPEFPQALLGELKAKFAEQS